MRPSRFRTPFMSIQPTSVGVGERLAISIEKLIKGAMKVF
jgi:hypothetical protein